MRQSIVLIRLRRFLLRWHFVTWQRNNCGPDSVPLVISIRLNWMFQFQTAAHNPIHAINHSTNLRVNFFSANCFNHLSISFERNEPSNYFMLWRFLVKNQFFLSQLIANMIKTSGGNNNNRASRMRLQNETIKTEWKSRLKTWQKIQVAIGRIDWIARKACRTRETAMT